MIDVLLVLLVIYMLAPLPSVKAVIASPPGASPRRVAPPPLTLELPPEGGYWLDGTAMSDSALAAALRTVVEDSPARVLLIVPGSERRYQEVITAMDIAKGPGVQVLSLMSTGSSH